MINSVNRLWQLGNPIKVIIFSLVKIFKFLKTIQVVLTDDSVQQTTSESLYKVLVGAVTPSLFRRRKRDTAEEGEGVTSIGVQEEGVAIEKFENISDSISDHH